MEFTNSELTQIIFLATSALSESSRILINNDGQGDYVQIQQYLNIARKCSQSLQGRERVEKAIEKIPASDEFIDSKLSQYHEELSPGYDAFRFAGLDTVRQLLEHSEDDLLKMKNIGQVKVKTIKRFLGKRGLKLKSSISIP